MQTLWQSGVAHPQDPVGAAERLILLNVTAIMLTIVVPVIVLTLGIAWWFRAGNSRVGYLPVWEYSGPVELVVWSIPALVVMFLGGIAWVSAHVRLPLDGGGDARHLRALLHGLAAPFLHHGQRR
ncbi:hypothetical protein [Reyranella sp.]|uniref:hypothetical protein n=1 Tax=Reyranella sp. TaxID=1929291 RepID=UPI003D0EBB70